MATLDQFLQQAVSQRASDLHMAAHEPVRLRIDGELVPLTPEPLTPARVQEILFEILSVDEQTRFLERKNLDKSYHVEGIGNFRVNIFMTRLGFAAVLRTIPQDVPTLQQLGLPESIQKLADLGKGLVLVTGPTGSGKSTTLAALINHINHKYKYHILTVEDPVEFVHKSKTSLINQREIGANCPTFADALKYALREDPDVILVGEMRDLETIGLALTAAETGHLVFGTLHTRGAGPSVDRIVDSFPANQQPMIRTMLSESLAAVVSQALLKKKDGKGRVAAYEIMLVNHAISNLIREGKTFQISSILQTARKEGMILLDQYIVELVDKGIVSIPEAIGYMEEPSPLLARMSGGARPAAAKASPTVVGGTPTKAPTKAGPGKPPPPPGTVVAPPAAPSVAAASSGQSNTEVTKFIQKIPTVPPATPVAAPRADAVAPKLVPTPVAAPTAAPVVKSPSTAAPAPVPAPAPAPVARKVESVAAPVAPAPVPGRFDRPPPKKNAVASAPASVPAPATAPAPVPKAAEKVAENLLVDLGASEDGNQSTMGARTAVTRTQAIDAKTSVTSTTSPGTSPTLAGVESLLDFNVPDELAETRGPERGPTPAAPAAGKKGLPMPPPPRKKVG